MTIFVFLCVLVTVAGACPIGWTQHEDSCYHFSHDEESWANAFTFCKILGGHLIEINTASEEKYIVDQVNQLNDRFWVGASDVLVEGEFLWMTSMTQVIYANWYPGQPDNHIRNENCVEIWYNKYWNDRACSDLSQYICESELRFTSEVQELKMTKGTSSFLTDGHLKQGQVVYSITQNTPINHTPK